MSSNPNKKKSKPPPPEDKGERAPLWIISFADMISLLMAFFVMLLTMAHTKSGKLCNPGEGVFEKTIFGFKSSISGLGLPGLFGRASEPGTFEYGKSHYNMSGDSNNSDGRTIDASEEMVRRLFNQLQKGMKTYSRQQRGAKTNFAVTPIVFQRGQAELDEDDKQFLKQFCLNLEESGNPQTDIYIMGLAPEGLPEQQKWLLSVRRAKAAGDYLKSVMSEQRQVPVPEAGANVPEAGANVPEAGAVVHCWGCGDNRQWTGAEAAQDGSPGFRDRQPQILIAVLHKSD